MSTKFRRGRAARAVRNFRLGDNPGRIEELKYHGDMTADESRLHPYAALEGTALWMQVDQAITELIQNRDLVEATAHPYVVGYICQKLVEADIVRR